MQTPSTKTIIIAKESPSVITYRYSSPQGASFDICLDFRNFTYSLPLSSAVIPWPALEGASGLDTLLYAIQLEL